MLAKPIVDFRLFMVRGVVLDEINAMAAFVKCRQQDFLEKIDVILGVEILGLMAPREPTVIEGDGAKDFLRIALATGGDLRL